MQICNCFWTQRKEHRANIPAGQAGSLGRLGKMEPSWISPVLMLSQRTEYTGTPGRETGLQGAWQGGAWKQAGSRTFQPSWFFTLSLTSPIVLPLTIIVVMLVVQPPPLLSQLLGSGVHTYTCTHPCSLGPAVQNYRCTRPVPMVPRAFCINKIKATDDSHRN